MPDEVVPVLQKSLDAIDSFRRRVYASGWIVAAFAIILTVTRTTKSILRAIELTSRRSA